MSYRPIGSQKNNKKEAQKREKKLASELGGKAMPNSGASDQRGDIKLDKYLIDDKFTNTEAYVIKVETLNKITIEAYDVNREPLLIIQFRKHIINGYPDEWILVPYILLDADFEEQSVTAKSTMLSAQMANRIYKKGLLADKEPGLTYIFHKVAIGVANKWHLLPLRDLKERGFFDAN